MSPAVLPDETAAGRRPGSPSTAPRDALWVAWNDHRRTTGLCDAWDVPLEVVRAGIRGPLRWIELPLRTLGLLRRRRPATLFVQNPSLALTALAVLVRPLFGYRLVVDAHNEGVRPYDRPYRAVRWLTRRMLRAADWTVVSNAGLERDVIDAGGRALVLADPLPLAAATRKAARASVDVVVVATYRPDEPIQALLDAAAALPDQRFAFTGDSRRFGRARPDIPNNVSLTGFLDDADYWDLLRQARVVCDLTLKPDCLVCGAYEALAVGRAMVLSDNVPTRALFGDAAVLTGSAPGEIAGAMRAALDRSDALSTAAARLRDRYPADWDVNSAQVQQAIWPSSDRQVQGAA